MRLVGTLVAFGLTLGGGGAHADAPRALAEALALQGRGQVLQAGAAAAQSGDSVVVDLVTWARLVDGEGSWGEMARHLDRNPAWPRSRTIRRHAERVMPVGLDPVWVTGFFAEGALTGTGAQRHAEALRTLGREAEADAVLERAWTALPLREEERLALQAREPAMTARLASQRLDAMLWDGNLAQAEALLPFVDPGWRRLGAARIALQARRNGVDSLVDAVPGALASDGGLAHDRFVWRLRSDLDDSALALIEERSRSATALGRPEAWADRRAALVRRLLRDGDAPRAYRLASLNHLNEGGDFAELEWLAGWIALRRLDDPARAAMHFEAVWEAVATPISKGRAGYWIGRAIEAQGDMVAARRWYARAADHATSFYGQLAAERIGRDLTADLAATGPGGNRTLLDGDLVRAVYLLTAAGEEALAYSFLLALTEGQTTAEGFAAAGRIALDLGRPEAAVRIGKIAAANGHVIMDIYYPVPDMAHRPGPIEPALALAITRQESEFNRHAVSSAGARGLMQLMPQTAQRVARDLGVQHTTAKLTADPAHNVLLGQTYLAMRLERYRGASILAAAAYNAGAGRVDEWIERFGDPRDPRVDAIDWIETIPFSETRNYVQRVMEGLHIYRARLGETPRNMVEALVMPMAGQPATLPAAPGSPASRPRG
jgi:soluble lytic murein transglycosylase